MSSRIFDPLIPSIRSHPTYRRAGRLRSVIRRRDGFTSWLVEPLRDAEIEFIIRLYATASAAATFAAT